jgi:multisubunit Na+/H+ antiporter MnhB subunit
VTARPAQVVAFVAALALLFVMAMDWYSTTIGDEARRIEGLSQPQGALGGEVERRAREDARLAAEGEERNAWQADGLIDDVILVLLLATVAITFLVVLRRLGEREPRPGLTAVGALAAAAAALLVAYRMWQEPGFDELTTVKAGAPLAIVVLGVISLALATAFREEERELSEAAGERATAEPGDPGEPAPA